MQRKIKLRCFETKMSSFLHYYKLKGFERDYIQILGFLKKKNSVRPTLPDLNHVFSCQEMQFVIVRKFRSF